MRASFSTWFSCSMVSLDDFRRCIRCEREARVGQRSVKGGSEQGRERRLRREGGYQRKVGNDIHGIPAKISPRD